MGDTPQLKVRTVTVRGVTYIRAEDIAEYIRDLAATEETDVRNRFNEAADNLTRLKER